MPLCMKDSRISRCWRILLTLFRFGGYGRIITIPIAPPSTDFRKALATSAADPLGIGSRERIPLVKVKDPRSENMINACTHEVYLGKRLVLSVIVEIG